MSSESPAYIKKATIRFRKKELLLILLIYFSYSINSSLTANSKLNVFGKDSLKRASTKQYNDSTKKVGYLSFKHDIGIEIGIAGKSREYDLDYFDLLDSNAAANNYTKNYFRNTNIYLQFGIQYLGASARFYFLNNRNNNESDSVIGKTGGFSFGIPYKRFHLNLTYDKSTVEYFYENRSLSSKNIHPKLSYRPFKTRYVNAMQNYTYNQLRSACAIDVILHYNYSKYSASGQNDSVFTHDYHSTSSLNLQDLNYLTLKGISVSVRGSLNLVIYRSLFFNLVLEYGGGIGKSILNHYSAGQISGYANPQNNSYSIGFGFAWKRIIIKAYAYGSGIIYNSNYNGNQTILEIEDDYVAAFAGISYRFKEPKKLKSFREKIISNGKKKATDIISPD